MSKRYIRMNNICLDLNAVETIEWEKVDDEYSVKLHMKSGKLFTRQVSNTQLKQLRQQFREIVGETYE